MKFSQTVSIYLPTNLSTYTILDLSEGFLQYTKYSFKNKECIKTLRMLLNKHKSAHQSPDVCLV